MNEKLKQLANLFREYKIYSQNNFTPKTPLKVFTNKHPDNNYSKDIESFIKLQPEKNNLKGADLPYWGNKFFIEEISKRVMIISQKSDPENFGSVTFYAHMLNDVESIEEYCDLVSNIENKKKFPFISWLIIKNLLTQIWRLNTDYLYVTDAIKLFKDDKKLENDINIKLLEGEISICKPDLLILLGALPLSLLDKNKVYGEVVESENYILINNTKTVVSPFPIGQGAKGNKNFDSKLRKATVKIKKFLFSLEENYDTNLEPSYKQ